MSPAKKVSNRHTPEPRPSGSTFKGMFIAGIWVAVIATGLWALMEYSGPSGEFVSYEEFKGQKTPPAPEPEPEAEVPELEQVSTIEDQDLSDLVQPTSDLSQPKTSLPRETLEHISRGIQLFEQGKVNASEMEFEKAAELSPNAPEVFSIWGASLRMQKKYPGANKRFARALELAPNDAEITFNWGVSRMEERASDEAIKLFKRTIELEPNNYLAYNYLGKSFGQKKMYAQEEENYRKVITMKPDFGWAHFNLAIVLSIQKKFEEAAPHFERAIQIDKSFEKPFVVQMLTAMGRYTPDPKKPLGSEDKKPEEVVQEAKAEIEEASKEEMQEEMAEGSHKKEEGSKMEGSKSVKPTTTLTGKFLINGKPPGPNSIVIIETKNKLKVPNQKTLKVTVNQSGLAFLPQHTVIPVNSTVVFANHDREVHNIYSKSQSNQFNLGAMAAGSSREMRFTQAGPVVLRCNMHSDMIGTIFVVPNGYYTRPKENGEYRFENVKSMDYILQAWAPHVAPQEVEAGLKSADLKGIDQTIDIEIKAASMPGVVHDMVDPTDYNAIVDNIEKELYQAIEDWANGKKYLSRKRALMAITKHYDGEGLKGAIAKSFSEKRSKNLENKLDSIRKKISGIGKTDEPVTRQGLESEAKFAIAQLRNNVRELEARINPDAVKTQ